MVPRLAGLSLTEYRLVEHSRPKGDSLWFMSHAYRQATGFDKACPLFCSSNAGTPSAGRKPKRKG